MSALATPQPPILSSSSCALPCPLQKNWAVPSSHRIVISAPIAAVIHRMSNRERARFYRQRNKQRVNELTTMVKGLRAHVKRLSLTAQLTRSLVSTGVPSVARRAILATLSPFFSIPRIALAGFETERVDFYSAVAVGCALTPVVEVTACIIGKHSRATVEAIYEFIPGNTVLFDCLLHSRVAYPTTVRFFFSPLGVCVLESTDIDWVAGLLESVGDLGDVDKIATPLKRLQEVGLRHLCGDYRTVTQANE